MENKDTISLLKECDAGTKMAVSSIDEVLESVKSQDMKQLLAKSKEHHKKLEKDIDALLDQYECSEKEPNPTAKGMSYLKTNMKMSLDNSDATVADLITDGCHMGTKSLHKYLNQYPAANETVKGICGKLIDIENQLCRDLEDYL